MAERAVGGKKALKYTVEFISTYIDVEFVQQAVAQIPEEDTIACFCRYMQIF